jgi:hypothetical protein
MKLKLYYLLIPVLVLSGITNHAQYIDYEHDSGWKFGLNIGGMYQQSDLQSVPGLGYGFTLGKALYQKPSRFWAFDLRFRYLRGFMLGYSNERNYGLLNNPQLNGTNSTLSSSLNYKDSTGYVFSNYSMDLHRYSLEGVLTFNRLRERTGIVLHVFGGVGLTDYRTKINQLNENGFQYNYASLDSTGVTQSSLNNLWDDTYETDAEGSQQRNIKFMPSLGIGLGYQFSPRFTMGIEHKVTFALNDLIDGYAWKNDNTATGNNDRYHYTAIHFTWHLFRGRTNSTTTTNNNNINNYTTTTTTTTTNTNTVTTPPPPQEKPRINFIVPVTSPFTSTNQFFNVNASVTNVPGRNNISFKLNGVENINFTYSNNSQRLNNNITLVSGTNLIEISAWNDVGYDYQSVIIVYNPPYYTQQQPPIVTITNPIASPHNTNNPNYNLTATVLNVAGAHNITFKFNGVVSNNFVYNVNTKAFSSLLNLVPGVNTIEIKAANNAGIDIKNATINYQPIQTPTVQPPVVTIFNPTLNPFTVNTNSATIDASVINVNSAAQITLKINGLQSSNFVYNPQSSLMQIVANLVEGTNVFEITATNVAGSDYKSTVIIYKKPESIQPPLVNFTDPGISPATATSAAKTIKASVLNVSSKNDITLKYNGVLNNNFTYNTTTKELSFSTTLNQGTNLVEISAVNNAGSDYKIATIIYQPVVSGMPPVVTFTNPTVNPFNTNVSAASIMATVLNITAQNQITFKVNGLVNNNFTYNVNTKVFSSTVNLIEGSNQLEISAVNNFGNDVKTTTIIYNKPCEHPTLTLLQPATANHVVQQSNIVLSAIANNITSQNDIIFKLNGTAHPFTFDLNTGTITANLNFVNENNTVYIQISNACGSSNHTIHVIYIKPKTPPVVNITNPAQNPHTVTTANFTIKATITNVTSNAGVSFLLNGLPNTGFSFNPNTQQFSANITLVPGNNTIQITGTNTDGSDSKTTTILFNNNQPVCYKPVIALTEPLSNPVNTQIHNLLVSGEIQNIQSASDITFQVNGVNSPFNFNPQNKQFSATASLNLGNNTITIMAKNQCGEASQTLTAIYNKPPMPPVVTIVNPGQNPFTTPQANLQLTAKIINITQASQITYKVNGVVNTGFTFNPVTHDFVSNVTLNTGANIFEISATNNDGTDTKSTTVIYEKPADPCIPPTITMIAPVTNPESVAQSAYSISANIYNVANNNQISFKQNGVNKTFTYNANTNKLTHNATLLEGSNTFEINVNGNCGNANVQFTIIYNKPKHPPVVTITNPSQNPHTTSSENATINATITNITAQNQITYKVNGNANTNFNFDVTTKVFTAAVTLQPANNTFEITATNTDGTDTKSTIIVYNKPPEPCDPPSVTFVNPNTNNTTVTNVNYTLNAKVDKVAGANNIIVKVNGQGVAFNYDVNTKSLTANINLQEGNNTAEIIATNNCGTSNEVTNIFYNKPVTPPVITITNPPATPHDVNAAAFMFTATVQYVSQANQITVKYNNAINNTFTFDANTGVVTLPVTLNQGNNTFEITATNQGGTDSKTATVKYTIPCNAPVITLQKPASANITVTAATLQIKAKITNVTAADIVLKQNGNIIQHNFNAQQIMSANTQLVEGANTFVITATNACGTAEITIHVTYNRPLQPPVVTITDPVANPHNTANDQYVIKANILHVNSASDITFKVNGISTTNFTYNTNTKEFSANVNLNTGNNSFEIHATNSDGHDSKTTTIIYTPCYAPVISLNNPNVSGTVTSISPYPLSLVLQHINSQQSIFLSNNSQTISNFNFNTQTKELTANVPLENGINNFRVIASNNCSQVTEEFSIKYQPAPEPMVTICHTVNGTSQTMQVAQSQVQSYLAQGATMGACPCYMPVINVTNPSTNATTVNSTGYSLTANIEHTTANQLSLTHNGNPITNFTFHNNQLTANLSLSNGANSIVISAQNTCGKENKTLVITYVEPAPAPCGPRFNPGNSAWEFCLVTPSGTFTRDNLIANNNFTYSGPASSAYFKPIAGGGDAIVNGSPYQLQNGQYYLFTGNLNVNVSSNHPGSMGHWSICITADNVPVFGNGNNRPASPCQSSNNNQGGGNNNNQGGGNNNNQGGGNNNNSNVDFSIGGNGVVNVNENVCATIKCLGEAVVYNNTQDAFVRISYSLNNGVDWYEFNNNNYVNGGEQETVQVPSGGKVVLKAYCQNPSGNWSNTITTNTGSQWVYVLKNGDNAPNIQPFQNQASAEQFLQGVVVNGKISIGPNDVIYLFELRHVGNVGVDYQDVVMLVTFDENATCFPPKKLNNNQGGTNTGGGTQKQGNNNNAEEDARKKAAEEAAKKAQEEAQRKAAEEAQRKAQQEAQKKAAEEAAKKAQEEAQRKAAEEAQRKAQQEAQKKAAEEAAKKAQEEAQRKAAEEAQRKAQQEAQKKAAEEAAKKAQEEAQRKAAEEAQRKAQQEAQKKAAEEAAKKAQEEAEKKKNDQGSGDKKMSAPAGTRPGKPNKESGKSGITVNEEGIE